MMGVKTDLQEDGARAELGAEGETTVGRLIVQGRNPPGRDAEGGGRGRGGGEGKRYRG